MNEWMSMEEATKYLGVSESTLYSLAQSNRIPANKVGKMWRFSKYDLDSWVKTNKPIGEFFTSVEFDIEENLLLRDPQKEAYGAAKTFFSEPKNKRAILQLPVGCGKSGLVAILPFGISKGRVLVVSPNLTIKQELERVLNVTDKRNCFWHKCKVLTTETMTAGPYLAVLDSNDSNIHDCDESHFVLTNIQQVSSDKWLSQFSGDYFDMIIFDEGHHNAAISWKKVFDKFPNAKIVSLTATPFRSDEKEVEGEPIYRYAFKRAMIKGYIKHIQATYVAPSELFFTMNGDTKQYSLNEVLQLKEETWFSRGVALSPVCNANIVDASLEKLEVLRQSGTKHQIIAVACSVNHAKAIRSLYAERGYEAAEIYSGMPEDQQKEVIQKLRTGILDCIVQVQMLGEGFDHPKLSVAAIFRPFRALSPYVQFVGRIMRVVVQNHSGHPDNYGHIVTHIGLNQDSQLEDFRKIDKEDQKFFKEIMENAETLPPQEVIEGKTRMKMAESMVVRKEIVQNFLEERFITAEDELLMDEMKSSAEALGFDADDMLEFLKKKQGEKLAAVPSSGSFTVMPQLQRREAKRRLNEEVKRASKILLNRLNLGMDGKDLAFKLAPGAVTGPNFAAAVQLVNHEINRLLGIKAGDKGKLKTEDYVRAQESLDAVINTLTRRLKKGVSDAEEKG